MSFSLSLSVTNENRIEPMQENRILLFWSVTVWLVVMNTTMFNVALPTVLAELSLTSTTVSWIVSGYSIAFAISSITFSRLSDYLPISRLLLIALSLFGAGAIIGFFAHQFYILLTARIIQAVGAGAVPGLAMVLAGRYIPVSRRGKAMSLIATAASLGFGLGPVVGGAITQYLSWNYLFGLTFFVVFLIPIFHKLLPKEEVRKGKFDLFGALLTCMSVTGLLLFLSTQSIILLLITVLLFIVLWRYLHKSEIPFIQPELFQDKQYVKLLLIGFSAFIIHFSTLFLMPIILTEVFDKGAAQVGLMIFPGAFSSALAARFIGQSIDRFGNKPILLFGQIFLIISCLLLAFFSTVSPYLILVSYLFMSPGFSALTSAISNEATRILPLDKIGSGMGLTQLMQFIGGGFGVTLMGLLLALQKDFSAAVVYRNIYLGLLMLILICMVLLFFYFRNMRSDSL
jgi:MFS transporter, DHA2 family, metal-tetracycline-proton antiporter